MLVRMLKPWGGHEAGALARYPYTEINWLVKAGIAEIVEPRPACECADANPHRPRRIL